MPVFFIAEIEVFDVEKYHAYKEKYFGNFY